MALKLSSSINYPETTDKNYLSFCSVSPLHKKAVEAAHELLQLQSSEGRNYYPKVMQLVSRYKNSTSAFLKTAPENISLVKNTAEGMSLIANGYPFKEGDEIISYVHEYPSNHFPWLIQAKKKGVKLKLLTNSVIDPDIPNGLPNGWSIDELVSLITDKTKVIAISHVQFASGFAADLPKLGQICRKNKIDLIVDAAQSIGALPLYPEEYGISGIAASGWKWLVGPMGTGVMYSSPALRDKLELTVCGADSMQQCPDYLDHSWNPFTDGRMFEYGPNAYSSLAALLKSIEDLHLPHDMKQLRDRIFQLDEIALDALDKDLFHPVSFPNENRSTIFSVAPKVKNLDSLVGAAEEISSETEL